jgi:hypothetical protein
MMCPVSDRYEKFARYVIQQALEGMCVDGGDIQDKAEELGIIEPVIMIEPCGPEGCVCAECGEFPLTCYRFRSSQEEKE